MRDFGKILQKIGKFRADFDSLDLGARNHDIFNAELFELDNAQPHVVGCDGRRAVRGVGSLMFGIMSLAAKAEHLA